MLKIVIDAFVMGFGFGVGAKCFEFILKVVL
jgi:hypothetical protein